MDKSGRLFIPAHRPNTRLRTAAAIPTLGAMAFMGLPVAALAQAVTFGDAPFGAPPSAFELGLTGQGTPGDWKIVEDVTAAGGRALAQVSVDRTDYRFPLAAYRQLTARNVEVTAHFKPVAGTVDQAGGVAVRLADFDNYYLARANALEDNVSFYRVVKGRRQAIAEKNIKVSSNEWHTLALRAQGDEFTVIYDGQTLFTIGDKTFLNEGKVAVWTKADSVTYFDRIEIRQLQ